jgi:hypothetical protein
LLLAGTVVIGAGHAMITGLDGAGTVRLAWTPADAPATTTARVIDDRMLSEVWGDRLTRLEIDVTTQGRIGTIAWTLEETQ